MENYILDINPIAFSVGPINVYWYGLAYMAGMVLGLFYALKIVDAKKENCNLLITKKNIDEIFIWIVFGIIFGARIGYVIFYNFDFYLNNPLLILSLWEGGMSFHGGALGVIIAIISYSKYHKIPILETGDIVCAVVPIGLFFGRITNFINGELWGKETNLSWGVIFPNAGSNPRHPSQLYEAGLEGLALFIILFALVFSNGLKKRGLISGTFLFFYSFSRILVENFREPDLHIGYIFLNITMGMILSLPFLIAGLILIFQSLKNEYS
ncbi:MAG: prolipoprotein diacylglyceryl transferase [Pseudomonadota bacterium]|nr:prolipoprotein diacylglyceryl transferase [Pseudomonadota bacterium]